MNSDKKTKSKKSKERKYEKKLVVNGSFMDIMNAAVQNAQKGIVKSS